MFQSTGEFRRTKEQRNYVFNNCIKKVTLPLKQNIGQLVGGANSCFSSSSSCYKETPSWERSQCIMEKLGNQAAVNLVLFFCGKVQNPEVIKKKCTDNGLSMKKWNCKWLHHKSSRHKASMNRTVICAIFCVLQTQQTLLLRNNSASNGNNNNKKVKYYLDTA